jgi:uncharacterized SAM-binding protein YcdF (DUF218 family)
MQAQCNPSACCHIAHGHLGSLLGAWRRWPRALRRLVLLVGVLAVLYGLRGWLLPLPGRFLDVSERPAPTDYVLVLNGDRETRPFVAAALVKAGLVPKVLVVQSVPSPDEEDGLVPVEHEIVKRVLLGRGVPEEAITILPGLAATTFDEARALAGFLDAHPEITVTVVTNRFHTRRARWVFGQVLGDRIAHLRFVGAPQDAVMESEWWRSPRGATSYLSEYAKFAYYLVHYR